MVFINDKKYACATCRNGHRSSTCMHTDRPLFEIKPKGRPATQCDKCRELRRTRRLHVKCVCDGRGMSDVDNDPGSRDIPDLPYGIQDYDESDKSTPSGTSPRDSPTASYPASFEYFGHSPRPTSPTDNGTRGRHVLKSLLEERPPDNRSYPPSHHQRQSSYVDVHTIPPSHPSNQAYPPSRDPRRYPPGSPPIDPRRYPQYSIAQPYPSSSHQYPYPPDSRCRCGMSPCICRDIEASSSSGSSYSHSQNPSR